MQLGVQLLAGADSATVASQVYKGPSSPSRLYALVFTFPSPKPACTRCLPPLSVATKITMANPSNTIVIADDEEFPRLEPGSSRPQRVPRRDYTYRHFENMIIESVNAEANTTPSRKRRRTETKESSALVPVPHKTYLFHS
jgi:hypothetical protein